MWHGVGTQPKPWLELACPLPAGTPSLSPPLATTSRSRPCSAPAAGRSLVGTDPAIAPRPPPPSQPSTRLKHPHFSLERAPTPSSTRKPPWASSGAPTPVPPARDAPRHAPTLCPRSGARLCFHCRHTPGWWLKGFSYNNHQIPLLGSKPQTWALSEVQGAPRARCFAYARIKLDFPPPDPAQCLKSPKSPRISFPLVCEVYPRFRSRPRVLNTPGASFPRASVAGQPVCPARSSHRLGRETSRSGTGAAGGFTPAPPRHGPSPGLGQRGPGWGWVLGVAVMEPCPG